MMRKLIRGLLAVAATVLLFAGALILVAYLGVVNVAATHGYVPGVEWFLGTLSDRSLVRHAGAAVDRGEIVVPSTLSDEMVSSGATAYAEMCAPCHGGPGAPRGEYGRGLTPTPPDLSLEAREYSPAELFWIVKHGLRHTGMPAFGPTHTDDELWAVIAFVERLSDMSPDAYRQYTAKAAQQHEH